MKDKRQDLVKTALLVLDELVMRGNRSVLVVRRPQLALGEKNFGRTFVCEPQPEQVGSRKRLLGVDLISELLHWKLPAL